MKHRTVRQLIVRPGIYTLTAEATVAEAARYMAENQVGAVLVVEGERLEGIFTERDALYRVLAEGRDPARTTLDEVMTRELVTLTPDEPAADALRLMRDIGFRHLPVVEDGRACGMISLRDFIGAAEFAAASVAAL